MMVLVVWSANRNYYGSQQRIYVTRKPTEQAEILKLVLSNCSIDELSLYPTYTNPFDLIARRAKNEEWSGREDLNLRPPVPNTWLGTLRHFYSIAYVSIRPSDFYWKVPVLGLWVT